MRSNHTTNALHWYDNVDAFSNDMRSPFFFHVRSDALRRKKVQISSKLCNVNVNNGRSCGAVRMRMHDLHNKRRGSLSHATAYRKRRAQTLLRYVNMLDHLRDRVDDG
jgi:hypothetical protein